MKFTIQSHLANPNMCRIPELSIRPMPECEGGGWYIPREQAEFIVRCCDAYVGQSHNEADGEAR